MTSTVAELGDPHLGVPSTDGSLSLSLSLDGSNGKATPRNGKRQRKNETDPVIVTGTTR